MTTIDFAGQVVLVTGGSRGIGRGIAERFAADGARVVVCGRTEPERRCRDGVEFVAADVREADQVDALVDGIAERHGRLDVLVNNAGGAPPVRLRNGVAAVQRRHHRAEPHRRARVRAAGQRA